MSQTLDLDWMDVDYHPNYIGNGTILMCLSATMFYFREVEILEAVEDMVGRTRHVLEASCLRLYSTKSNEFYGAKLCSVQSCILHYSILMVGRSSKPNKN